MVEDGGKGYARDQLLTVRVRVRVRVSVRVRVRVSKARRGAERWSVEESAARSSA